MGNHKKALKFQLENLPTSYPHLAVTFNNIALVYGSLGDALNALLYFQKTVQTQEKVLPSIHPELAVTDCNMGNFSALSSHQKALEIQQKSLSHDHPNLAITY